MLATAGDALCPFLATATSTPRLPRPHLLLLSHPQPLLQVGPEVRGGTPICTLFGGSLSAPYLEVQSLLCPSPPHPVPLQIRSGIVSAADGLLGPGVRIATAWCIEFLVIWSEEKNTGTSSVLLGSGSMRRAGRISNTPPKNAIVVHFSLSSSWGSRHHHLAKYAPSYNWLFKFLEYLYCFVNIFVFQYHEEGHLM
jgi:hypothetical protein